MSILKSIEYIENVISFFQIHENFTHNDIYIFKIIININ